ncbi:MAG: thermonuclease family protein [Planctomycetota bacterium]
MKYLKTPIVVLAILALCAGCAGKPASAPARAMVANVTDGDSFVLANGDKVRLIGIDAPEAGDPGADIAKAFLERLILDKELRFEKGDENKDDYGRLLRYVFVSKTFVNAEMVKNGYAQCRYDSKDEKYKEQLHNLQKDAEEFKRGLWAFGTVFQPSKPKAVAKEGRISWKAASKHINETKVVEGKVIKAYNSGKACFLDFDKRKGTFGAVIFPENYDKFPKPPEEYYLNKKVRITGLIKEYQGAPEIVVTGPEQIEIISGSSNP